MTTINEIKNGEKFTVTLTLTRTYIPFDEDWPSFCRRYVDENGKPVYLPQDSGYEVEKTEPFFNVDLGDIVRDGDGDIFRYEGSGSYLWLYSPWGGFRAGTTPLIDAESLVSPIVKLTSEGE